MELPDPPPGYYWRLVKRDNTRLYRRRKRHNDKLSEESKNSGSWHQHFNEYETRVALDPEINAMDAALILNRSYQSIKNKRKRHRQKEEGQSHGTTSE
jgi:hypothetical protein